MKVISKPLQDGHVWLEALATAKEVDQAFNKAHIRFANQMGWRPQEGKTVAQVAEEKMGIKDLDSIVADYVVEYLGPFAIDKRGITPACPADPVPMGPLVRGKEFPFRITILPKPSYELESYEPVEITAPKMEVTDDQVEQSVTQMISGFAQYVKLDENRPVALGDSVLLKMDTSMNGAPLPNMTFESRPYVTGENYMPAGFDDNLVGMMPGETKSFTFQAPDFNDAGETEMVPVNCTVTVKELQQSQMPELTDEWVKRFMPGFDSADQLRSSVRARLESQAAFQQRDVLQQLAGEKLGDRFKGSIPDELYEAMMKNMRDAMTRELAQQGTSLEDYTKEMGGEQQMTMMMMMQVRQNMAQGFALDALFAHEGLQVTSEDIDQVCRSLNPQNPKAIREEMETSGRNYILKESAARLKAANWAVDHAIITYA
ncbi:MAG: trigger factor [Coriobacteriia bacterium]|nr:trigger factor [Coriobacteriia bacterium]